MKGNQINERIQRNNAKEVFTTTNSIKEMIENEGGTKEDINNIEKDYGIKQINRSNKIKPTIKDKDITDTINTIQKEIEGIPHEFIFCLEEIGFQIFEGINFHLSVIENNTKKKYLVGRESKMSNSLVCFNALGERAKTMLMNSFKGSEQTIVDRDYFIVNPNTRSSGLKYYNKQHFSLYFKKIIVPDIIAKKKKTKYNGNVVILLDEYFEEYANYLIESCLNDEPINNECKKLKFVYFRNNTSYKLNPFHLLISHQLNNKRKKQTPVRILQSKEYQRWFISLSKLTITKAFAKVIPNIAEEENLNTEDSNQKVKEEENSNTISIAEADGKKEPVHYDKTCSSNETVSLNEKVVATSSNTIVNTVYINKERNYYDEYYKSITSCCDNVSSQCIYTLSKCTLDGHNQIFFITCCDGSWIKPILIVNKDELVHYSIFDETMIVIGDDESNDTINKVICNEFIEAITTKSIEKVVCIVTSSLMQVVDTALKETKKNFNLIEINDEIKEVDPNAIFFQFINKYCNLQLFNEYSLYFFSKLLSSNELHDYIQSSYEIGRITTNKFDVCAFTEKPNKGRDIFLKNNMNVIVLNERLNTNRKEMFNVTDYNEDIRFLLNFIAHSKTFNKLVTKEQQLYYLSNLPLLLNEVISLLI